MNTDAIALLDRTGEVDVEVRTAGGKTIRVPIWVVVIDRVPYIASVRGEAGAWYRALRASGKGALTAGETRIEISAQHVDTPEIRAAVSDAYARKYPNSKASVASMQTPKALGTILRVHPV